jgi:hypothetical protein
MRTLFTLLLAVMVLGHARAGSTGHVYKVLPLLLDAEGRIATSPSLFDRDAYQVQLREHPDQVSGVRYSILWKAPKSADARYVLRLELRGVAPDGKPRLKTIESPVKPGLFRKWSSFTIAGEELKQTGNLVAWRATLLDGASVIGEQKSFLW